MATRTLRAALTALALAGAVSACSSSGETDADADADAGSPAATAGAPCASAAAQRRVALPSTFPADFPLPPSTHVYEAEDRGSAGIVVSAVTSTSFPATLHLLQTKLPAAGFTPSDGEVEPHDAESDWSSSKYDGRWAIRELDACDGDTLVSVVARPTS